MGHSKKERSSSGSPERDTKTKRHKHKEKHKSKKFHAKKSKRYEKSSSRRRLDSHSSSSSESRSRHKAEYKSKYSSHLKTVESNKTEKRTYRSRESSSDSSGSKSPPRQDVRKRSRSLSHHLKDVLVNETKKIVSQSVVPTSATFLSRFDAEIYSQPSVSSQNTNLNDESDTDSEDELMFDWENHRYELNQMFFRDDDVIKRGTEEYYDFWKFLKKYHGLQKQKKIREMCNNRPSAGSSEGNPESSVYQLPLHYDKRYNINFALSFKDTDDLRRRLPPQDLEDGKRRLSRKKLVEIKFIIVVYLDFMQKQRFERLKKLRSSQANLPIAEYKDEIISTVGEHNVVIIAGDTGCGKSTQVPQYLLSAGYSNIACTQPRRIACISLSKRVAYETLNEFGSKVGYQIRFEKNKTEHTRIVFLTEGLLLRQVSADTSLGLYDVVILDEIHERHLDTDFLLGVMKCLLMQRENVKIVLMSATINIDLFRSYFLDKAPVIQVPGRLYPIKLQYFPVPSIEQASKREKINPAPYVRILQLIDNKYPDNERGDLLIFLSGMSEISTIVEAAKVYAQQTNRWIILPLHSTLSVSEQEKVFDVPPEGIRKCIVSTNIAETSITIDGVRFVVDSGKVKEMSYDVQSKMRKLKEFWISQASAEQRKGRAGRTGPGTCFRLYSEQEYASFSQYSTPELQRVPLDSLVLQMISMGLPNIRLFPFIEPPAPESLDNALHALKAQAAITEVEGLTTIGKLLSQLPMDVSLGKMLIMGSLFHQVEPVLSLSAAMSVQSPFTNRAHRDPECVASIKSLESDHGDPLTLLASYREWLCVKQEGHENSRKWCRRRGLEEQRFYEMTKLRHQFAQLLHDSGLQDIAGCSRAHLTSAERAQRSGQLRQLRELKRELHKDGPRKTKVLKVSQGESIPSDEEESRTDIKDVDFRIKNDQKQLQEIFRSSTVRSYKDMIMLKIILCSGLYPNVAIGDDHNNYKAGSEQLFHTSSKPFTVLHPNSVFASHPEVLQVVDSDIVELPGFTTRHPASTKHQLLVYVSLLETNKPYLVDTLRVPAAQVLLLFAHNVDTNADLTVIACDNFIELKFPDAMLAQNLVFQSVQLRLKWKHLLDLRIQATTPTIDNLDRIITEANRLEKDLVVALVDFFLTEVIYSKRRLLAADIKVLHAGPGPGDCILSGNPFSEDGKQLCQPNDIKGGVDLTEFLTYNCLLDTECMVTTITTYDTVCPYCDQEFQVTTLERLAHMVQCLKGAVQSSVEVEEEAEGASDGDPTKKKYQCNVCNKTLWLNIKDIFRHKKSHMD
ncbi:probable ATP-dependent RNA helicase DHX34 [Homarus americanus]|uniref:ATP-dependent RNA helicase DHX34-like n=1 Tax=Homarus americanus TaxID=6706 RepID=A0A8J5JYG5_HOMAM|nr:probable ATP-dependent RNA helicase DHX34 [Homarus americanus]KAG7163889.1 ATP-dependent RNA helicase DHX34-like [Homarus americanus]